MLSVVLSIQSFFGNQKKNSEQNFLYAIEDITSLESNLIKNLFAKFWELAKSQLGQPLD